MWDEPIGKLRPDGWKVNRLTSHWFNPWHSLYHSHLCLRKSLKPKTAFVTMHECDLQWKKTYIKRHTFFPGSTQSGEVMCCLRTQDAHLCSNLLWCLILTTRWWDILVYSVTKPEKGIFIRTFQSPHEFHSVFSLTFLQPHWLVKNLSLLSSSSLYFSHRS